MIKCIQFINVIVDGLGFGLVRSLRNELISSSAISFGCGVLPVSSESRMPLRSNWEDNHCLRLSSSLKDFTVNILDDVRDANAAICISKLKSHSVNLFHVGNAMYV